MIVDGDAERMYQQLISHRQLLNIELDSPGGSVVEALKMASLISGLKVSTKTPTNKICASSCFFLFLAGEPREAAGKIGLHRPYMSKQFFNSVDAEQSSKSQTALMQEVSAYLESKLVPRQLIEMMMNRPSTEVYWMTAKDIANLGEYSPDREELFTAKCGYDRKGWERTYMSEFVLNVQRRTQDTGILPRTDLTSETSELEQEKEALRKTDICILNIRVDEGYEFFANLKAGWKPWTGHQRRKKYSGAGKWVKVGGNDIITSYVDPTTIRRAGDMAEMWTLVDYKTVQQESGQDGISSSTAQQEYDCKNGRIRNLYMSDYSGNMAKGKVSNSSPSSSPKWTPVSPDSVGYSLLKIACSTK